PANQQEAGKIVQEFAPIFENETILKIGQNIKYDITVLQNYGIEVKGPIFDTMLAHYLIEPDMRHNMDAMANYYLKYAPVSIETLIGKKGVKQKSMRDMPITQIAEYAAEDAEVTLQLKHIFAPKLKEQNTEKLFNEVEVPLIEVLADMETTGVKIDVDALAEFSVELGKDIQQLEREIYEEACVEFNIASPKQLGEVLFDKLK